MVKMFPNWDGFDQRLADGISKARPFLKAGLFVFSFFRFAAIFSLCTLGLGCAALNVQKPTANVTGMSLQGVTAQGFIMNFAVSVTNPNSIALPLAAADYKLGVGGANLLDGNAKPEGSLPANGSRAIALPVTVTFENLLVAEKAIQAGGGNIPYDLSGGLTFDTGTPLLGQLRVPLTYNGTLSLREILKDPKALFGSDAAKKLAALVMGRFFGH